MRTNIWLFAILSTFFGASAAVYAGWSLIEPTGYQLSVAELTGVVPPEWVGTVGISLMSWGSLDGKGRAVAFNN